MSVISRTRSSSPSTIARALAIGACLASAAPLSGCARFGAGPSLVAQGKYYSSGNPQYDEFFIALYQAQVQMADAPRVPDGERQTLARALGLAPETPADGVAQRLHEEALKLGRSGLRMRLEQKAAPEKPEAASATVHATYRPKDDAATTLLSVVESCATNLLRSVGAMQAADVRLGKLKLDAQQLSAELAKAFAEATAQKQSEVQKNLSDGQKLITLMQARKDEVHAQSQQLLALVAQAVDTDDGSLSTPSAEPTLRGVDSKKAGPPRAKPKAASSASAANAAKPKPSPPASRPKQSGGDDDAPAKPAAPSKPAPPPRDFEP